MLGYIDIKSKKARKIPIGEPIIVIKEGNIMENALRKTRLDINELNSLLREKDVFSLRDVEFAIFETSGKLSVLKKEHKQSLTKSDISIQSPNQLYYTATEVISDGVINFVNLSRLNLEDNWLREELEKAGIKSIDKVFYAEIQPDGSIYFDCKDDELKI